mgnify:CR=1 FL=1
MLNLYVDFDGCPVKQEIFRVAERYGLQVTLVANSWSQVPACDWISLVVVKDHLNAADDWIAENAAEDDIVITADVPLASRCLANSARVLGPKGRAFTDETIGDALASRELMSHLRETGTITGGPAPFAPKDRSMFLQKLDETIQAIRRKTNN